MMPPLTGKILSIIYQSSCGKQYVFLPLQSPRIEGSYLAMMQVKTPCYRQFLINVFLKKHRKSQHMSLRKFAKLMKTSHPLLSSIERGDSPVTREMILNYCEATGFDVDEMLAMGGMVGYEYADAVRLYSDLFITLFQLLKNTSSQEGSALNQYAGILRRRHSLCPGKVQIPDQDVAKLYRSLGKRFQDMARAMERRKKED